MKRREFQKRFALALLAAVTGTAAPALGADACKKCKDGTKCPACAKKSRPVKGQAVKTPSGHSKLKEKQFCSGPPPVTDTSKLKRDKPRPKHDD